MVRFDRVNDGCIFAITASKIGTDDRMRALDLVIDRFAKIVKKTRTTSRNRIKTKLGCHDAAKIGNFKRVREHILPI